MIVEGPVTRDNKMMESYCGKPLDRQQGCLFRSCISKLQLHSLRQRSPQHPMPLPPKSNLFKSDYLIFFLLKSYCKHSHQDKELHPERTLRTLPILCQSVVEKRGKALFVTGGIIKGPFKRMSTISYGQYTCITKINDALSKSIYIL